MHVHRRVKGDEESNVLHVEPVRVGVPHTVHVMVDAAGYVGDVAAQVRVYDPVGRQYPALQGHVYVPADTKVHPVVSG